MTAISITSQKQLITAAFLGTLAFFAYKVLIVGTTPSGQSHIPAATRSNLKNTKKSVRPRAVQENLKKEAIKSAILREKKIARESHKKLEAREKEIMALLYEQAVKKAFKEKAYLEIDLPPDYTYREINVDTGEDFILHGTAKGGNSEFTVVASEKTPSKSQVLKMLRSGIGEIPNIGQAGLKSLFEVQKGPAGPASGIRDFTLFAGKNPKGQQTYVALAPRSDGKGTYLFVLSADKNYVEENEGTFENLQGTIRALSP